MENEINNLKQEIQTYLAVSLSLFILLIYYY